MAKQWENKKRLLVVKMSWREYVAATDTFGICDCCGSSDFDEGGYYVALVNDWYCKTCFDAYYSGAVRASSDLIKERENWNKMVGKLRDLGCWGNE